jgi:hypothetical protein
MTLLEHLREQLIQAELADDQVRAAELRGMLNMAASQVRETRG